MGTPFFLCPLLELWDSRMLPCQISLSPCIFARMYTVPITHTSAQWSIQCALFRLFMKIKVETLFLVPWSIPYYRTFHRFRQTPPFFLLLFPLFVYVPSLSMSLGIQFHFTPPDLFWCCPLPFFLGPPHQSYPHISRKWFSL